MKHKITITILSLAAVILICLASCKKEPDCNICKSVIRAVDKNGVLDESKTVIWDYHQEDGATCLLTKKQYKEEVEDKLNAEVDYLTNEDYFYTFTLDCD